MFQWIAANWLTIVCAAAVLGLVAVSLWNIVPRKGKPSACAGFKGLKHICSGEADCPAPDENSTHIVWATGGNMVPYDEQESYYIKGCLALGMAE